MRRRQFKYKQPHYIIPSPISISCELWVVRHFESHIFHGQHNMNCWMLSFFLSLFLHNWLAVLHTMHAKVSICNFRKTRLWPATISRRHINIFPLWILFSLFCVRCSVFGVRSFLIFNIRIRSIQISIQQCFFFLIGEPVIFVTNSTCVTGVHLTWYGWLY